MTDDFTPPQKFSFVEKATSDRKAKRWFWAGLIIGSAAIWIADAALSETIQIGRAYVNGLAYGTTTVTLEPSDEPGELATVVMQNAHVNQGADTGTYWLTIPGLSVEVDFEWDRNPLTGADSITVYPPAGITCLPVDCSVTVEEGFSGAVVLYDFLGF